jgi:hypothetical protein
LTADTAPPHDTDAKRSWFRGFGRYLAWFLILECLVGYAQQATTAQPARTNLRAALVQRLLWGVVDAGILAIIFTLLQNALNNERRGWLTVVLVFVSLALIHLLVSIAIGKFV